MKSQQVSIRIVMEKGWKYKYYDWNNGSNTVSIRIVMEKGWKMEETSIRQKVKGFNPHRDGEGLEVLCDTVSTSVPCCFNPHRDGEGLEA